MTACVADSALAEALVCFEEADAAVAFWHHKRNIAGENVMRLLNVNPRFTTLSFSTASKPWKWRAKRGAHLTPTARRELRRLQGAGISDLEDAP